MRLDKYLKVSRIIKRRTVANEACDTSHVTVNGRPAKASCDVKAGDIIEITFGERTMKVRVLSTAEHVGKAEAADLYEAIV
ncbi:MAG: RNA-binding S4 domain-containing protein [Lachnospiraceae bacterium]|nr:RNA-binding S4 domain-containing protein [Lachnospiraceae bacterium]